MKGRWTPEVLGVKVPGPSGVAARWKLCFLGLAVSLLVSVGCSWKVAPPEAPLEALEALDPPARPGSLAPFLSPGPLLSWLEPDPEGHRLVYSRLLGSTWEAPVEVARGGNLFANWADVPAVTESPSGSLYAHWLESLGEDTYAYGIRWKEQTPRSGVWSEEAWLHEGDTSETEHGFVSWLHPAAEPLASEAPETSSPTTWAFWLDGRNHPATGSMSLRGKRWTAAGSEGWVLDERVCDCCPTAAALTHTGPVVVYRDRSEDEIRDISLIRWAEDRWSSPVRVFEDGWEIAGCPVNGPAVAANGARLAVAWFTAPSGRSMVRVAFSGDGGKSFGTPILIDGEAPLGRVAVALLPAGEALVSWLGRKGQPARGGEGKADSRAELRLRRVSLSGAAGDPLTLAEVDAGRSSGFPRILVDGETLLLAWLGAGPESPLRGARIPLESIPGISR